MYFVFIIKIKHTSVPRDNGKFTWTELSKLYLCDYLKSHRNVEKRLIITEASI